MVESLQLNAHQPNHGVAQKRLTRSEDAQPPQRVRYIQWQVPPSSSWPEDLRPFPAKPSPHPAFRDGEACFESPRAKPSQNMHLNLKGLIDISNVTVSLDLFCPADDRSPYIINS